MAISSELHIRPWELKLLSLSEFDQACAWIDMLNEQAKKGR